jgi:hypothetical protein
MPNRDDYPMQFRPASYWDHADPVAAIVQNVKGDLRRELIRDILTAGGEKRAHYEAILGDLDDELYAPTASNSFRARMALVNPHWLGGELLPDCLPGEVEIARLVLDSVTRDVYSIRARRVRAEAGAADGEGPIVYRIVDEYEGRWVLPRETSAEPLTLGELVDLIDGSCADGVAAASLTDALRDGCEHAEAGRDFVRVSSEIYPELEAWYEERAAEWYARQPGASVWIDEREDER